MASTGWLRAVRPSNRPRRVVAAALAGYVAINVRGAVAAVEFGIQPLLFHDAAGAPLYAPYPLHIAIPAMMIGHLTIAGLAEMVISGGVVAWLQRAEPHLLEATSGGTVGWKATRPLWTALAVLMILTPLGVLAAGTAWGEWAPGPEAPEGMRRLAAFWTAPMPHYAPPFLHSAGLGYVLSAMAGTGLIILAVLIAGRLTRGRSPQ